MMHVFHKWSKWEDPKLIESGLLNALAQRKICMICNQIEYRKVRCDDSTIYSETGGNLV